MVMSSKADGKSLNGCLESEQADVVLKRVDLSSDSSSADVQEDAHEQRRQVSPKERRREEPPTLHRRIVRRFITECCRIRPRGAAAAGGEHGGEDAAAVTSLGAFLGHDLSQVDCLAWLAICCCQGAALRRGSDTLRRVVAAHAVLLFEM